MEIDICNHFEGTLSRIVTESASKWNASPFASGDLGPAMEISLRRNKQAPLDAAFREEEDEETGFSTDINGEYEISCTSFPYLISCSLHWGFWARKCYHINAWHARTS